MKVLDGNDRRRFRGQDALCNGCKALWANSNKDLGKERCQSRVKGYNAWE